MLLSITWTHDKIRFNMTSPESRVAPYLDRLRGLEFVRKLNYTPRADSSDIGVDGVLTIETPKGKYALSVERKNSYLDRALLNAFIIQAKHYAGKHQPLLLFTRYVPQPSAERLIRSRVNFLDQAGNMHLALGENYVRTVLGNKEERGATDERSMTPAKVQLLFTLATDTQAGSWTVRQLAEVSGLSKSNVAKLRQQLVRQGIIRGTGNSSQLRSAADIEEQLVLGYEQILRPKLLFNRFRLAESPSMALLEKLRPLLAEHSIHWSLTGGAGAFELQRFYKGPELVVFLDSPTESMTRLLRLFPDREGPITVLRGFGTLSSWQQVNDTKVAHPWLIYAELMRSADPRAHEAAAELKREFLKA